MLAWSRCAAPNTMLLQRRERSWRRACLSSLLCDWKLEFEIGASRHRNGLHRTGLDDAAAAVEPVDHIIQNPICQTRDGDGAIGSVHTGLPCRRLVTEAERIARGAAGDLCRTVLPISGAPQQIAPILSVA